MSAPDKSIESTTTLNDFIESNHKLLSTLGIFTALSVFATNLPHKAFGHILSFVFMGITLLLWFELFGRFPAKGAARRLVLFEGLISICAFLVAVNWFVQFSWMWEEVIVLPIFITIFVVLIYVASTVIKRFDLFNRVFRVGGGQKKWLRYFVGICMLLLFSILSLFATALIVPKAKTLLKEVREVTREFQPFYGNDSATNRSNGK